MAATFIDPLYGQIEYSGHLSELIQTPAMQRLRHVRLSNIDSVDIPSIGQLSRFEHVLGVGHLAQNLGLRPYLQEQEYLVLAGAALLHDWAITSFGHLVEEALQYVDTRFDHELRLAEIVAGDESDIGGADLQIFLGFETGLRRWSRSASGADGTALLLDIVQHIRGSGRYGRIISGDIDIDNIDNVFRMAFHMGLPFDSAVPLKLAKAIVSVVPGSQVPVFRRHAKPDIEVWQRIRSDVYQRLMLSRGDFVGKSMLLAATVEAFKIGEITLQDWKLVDFEFVTRLLGSGSKFVSDTTRRWLIGDRWEKSPLYWVKGRRPAYSQLLAYSEEASLALGQHLFAYGIKDKRNRSLVISYDDGSSDVLGKDTDQWLMGFVSASRSPLKSTHLQRALELAGTVFGSASIVEERAADPENNLSLF